MKPEIQTESQTVALGENETATVFKENGAYAVKIQLLRENYQNTFFGYPPGSLGTVDKALEYAREMVPTVYEDYGEYLRSKY